MLPCINSCTVCFPVTFMLVSTANVCAVTAKSSATSIIITRCLELGLLERCTFNQLCSCAKTWAKLTFVTVWFLRLIPHSVHSYVSREVKIISRLHYWVNRQPSAPGSKCSTSESLLGFGWSMVPKFVVSSGMRDFHPETARKAGGNPFSQKFGYEGVQRRFSTDRNAQNCTVTALRLMANLDSFPHLLILNSKPSPQKVNVHTFDKWCLLQIREHPWTFLQSFHQSMWHTNNFTTTNAKVSNSQGGQPLTSLSMRSAIWHSESFWRSNELVSICLNFPSINHASSTQFEM